MGNDEAKFRQDVYTHMGEQKQFALNMKEYITAVSTNCKTGRQELSEKIDRHFYDHAKEIKSDLQGEKLGIVSERRHNVATWLQVVAIALPTAISIVAMYISVRTRQ